MKNPLLKKARRKGILIVALLLAAAAVILTIKIKNRPVQEEKFYENVWVIQAGQGKAMIFMDGQEVDYTCVLDENVTIENCMADIVVRGDKLISMAVKNTRISAKVLAMGEDYIELEEYGRVPVAPSMKVYKTGNPLLSMTRNSIIVGYNQQEFIVGDGKICGALINRSLEVQNIRVLIKTSGFEDLFHSEVSLTGGGKMLVETLNSGQQVQVMEVEKGDTLVVNEDSGHFERLRITLEEGEITLSSIQRSQGAPSYEGSMEIVKTENGFVVINEVDIERYLKRVVPSEMPASYGLEALKVQAVCARSYAYMQLNNDTYKAYGAHLDDSVQYQVYNNTYEKEESNQAISATSHQVLTYEDNPVKAFYYSTSCGFTSDLSVWGSDAASYPYYQSCRVAGVGEKVDMSSNESFAQAIKGENKEDYDYEYPLYRWKMTVELEDYSGSVAEKLRVRQKQYPDRIVACKESGEETGEAVSVSGKIKAVEVVRRSSGGAVLEAVIVFEEGRVKLYGENNVRYIFGWQKGSLTDKAGNARSMDSLPSAYCIFETVQNQMVITGGGYGHGIGMSQNAVRTMAAKGIKYNEILTFFYPGTRILSIEMFF